MQYTFNVARITAQHPTGIHHCRVALPGIPTPEDQLDHLKDLRKAFPVGQYAITLIKEQTTAQDVDLDMPFNRVLRNFPHIATTGRPLGHGKFVLDAGGHDAGTEYKAAYFQTADGGSLALEVVIEELNKDPHLFDDKHDPQWFIVGWTYNTHKAGELLCDHTNKPIPTLA